jgi:hypothetical protein
VPINNNSDSLNNPTSLAKSNSSTNNSQFFSSLNNKTLSNSPQESTKKLETKQSSDFFNGQTNKEIILLVSLALLTNILLLTNQSHYIFNVRLRFF